jgi:gluconolactonase
MTTPPLAATIFASDLDHPEGLAVAPDGTIWAGGEEGQIYVVGPDGAASELARTGGFSAGLAFDRDGCCFVCNPPRRIVRVEADGRWETFAESVEGVPMRTPNFPVFGPDGSLYVSDSGSWDVADGVIYRFPPGSSDGEVFHRGPFHYTNGLAIDVAGDYLYVVETALHSVVRLRIAEGSAAAPEAVCAPGTLEWMPDGIALDAAGALYVTMFSTSRIYRIEPGGEPEMLVEDVLGLTLNRPTNCAFGGPGFDRLFVANLGGRMLSVVDVGRPGQPLYGGPGAR